ncbi:M56 family metallopeptidase [Pinibacter soli]|uniref:M56 family metallopeptidase n=1 Tax=Pinibacter soli TaxID=3044211 RepID=A0ABT6RBZ3_9BACT|nr:M56 family metallopeptidase [Pinibacter soli]MDI3320079.1 M56 family metallopeptidase [Pinibacter soli]
MTAIAYYLLKMLICSGILTAYYYACLQNKLFHQWNRFYLLLTVIFSITFPLLYIPIFDFNETSNAVGQMVYKVSASELLLLKNQTQSVSFFNLMVYGTYCVVAIVFLSLFIVSLYKIHSLKRRSTFIEQSDINIYQTNASQAPFSFFKNIFWKQDINLQSTEGQQILKHELVHVHEKHSADKVFMQLVLSVFWINPFFWLIKKELTIIHEFIADKKSIGNNDASVLASLILTTAYSSGRFDITNQFFHSSIKRRITMVTKIKDPRFSYIRRIAALFVLLATLGMVAFRSKNVKESGVIKSGKDTSITPTKRGSVDTARKGSISLDKANPIYYIDGREATKADIDKVNPNDIQSIDVWKGEKAIEKFGEKGKHGVVDVTMKKEHINKPAVINTATNHNITLSQQTPDKGADTAKQVSITNGDITITANTIIVMSKKDESGSLINSSTLLYILDGKEINEKDFKTINPNNIESITVWKDSLAIEKFGDKGKNGVIDIVTKKTINPASLTP